VAKLLRHGLETWRRWARHTACKRRVHEHLVLIRGADDCTEESAARPEILDSTCGLSSAWAPCDIARWPRLGRRIRWSRPPRTCPRLLTTCAGGRPVLRTGSSARRPVRRTGAARRFPRSDWMTRDCSPKLRWPGATRRPGLATRGGLRTTRGYDSSVRKAVFFTMTPRGCAKELRSAGLRTRRGAGSRLARRFPFFLAEGLDAQVLVGERRTESSRAHVQGKPRTACRRPSAPSARGHR